MSSYRASKRDDEVLLIALSEIPTSLCPLIYGEGKRGLPQAAEADHEKQQRQLDLLRGIMIHQNRSVRPCLIWFHGPLLHGSLAFHEYKQITMPLNHSARPSFRFMVVAFAFHSLLLSCEWREPRLTFIRSYKNPDLNKLVSAVKIPLAASPRGHLDRYLRQDGSGREGR